MKQTLFPTLEEALYLHEELTARFGGAGGVHDLGLLESALARPRSGYYKTLCEQAAALMHSLARSHCFVDGNKRMAFALTAVFLEMNCYQLIVKAGEGEHFLINEVIVGKAEVPAIAAWIERHLKNL